MERILSGMRPSGKLHIGHLFGVLHNWRELQKEYECYFEIADWHALTTDYEDTSYLRENIIDMVIDWLTVGIDPQKSVLFVQSDIKEHAELHLLFSMLVSLSRLLRNPTFKEYVAELKTKELRTSGKRILEDASERAISKILEEFWNRDLQTKEMQNILKAKFKETFIESISNVFVGENEDELSYGHLVNYGFLGYPVLQAADILIYKAKYVPIGEDQLPHLELTREIARRFNKLYGEVFPIPEPLFTEHRRVPGIDGRKMSKSLKNTILIAEPENTLKEKLMRMYTDPEKIRKNDPGHPDKCPVFALHEIFNRENAESIKKECEKGTRGCVLCKNELFEKMNAYMEPIREERRKLEARKDIVHDILNEGKKRAKLVVESTMQEVRRAMKLWD